MKCSPSNVSMNYFHQDEKCIAKLGFPMAPLRLLTGQRSGSSPFRTSCTEIPGNFLSVVMRGIVHVSRICLSEWSWVNFVSFDEEYGEIENNVWQIDLASKTTVIFQRDLIKANTKLMSYQVDILNHLSTPRSASKSSTSFSFNNGAKFYRARITWGGVRTSPHRLQSSATFTFNPESKEGSIWICHQRGTYPNTKTSQSCLHGCGILWPDDGYCVQPEVTR